MQRAMAAEAESTRDARAKVGYGDTQQLSVKSAYSCLTDIPNYRRLL